MIDFEITVSLKGKELWIAEENSSGVKSFVNNEEDVVRCIKNYITIYIKKVYYCEHCGARINTETDVYFESDSDSVVYCEKCADEHLMFSDSIDSYVHESQYKDTYMDDEISDLDLYIKREPEGDI